MAGKGCGYKPPTAALPKMSVGGVFVSCPILVWDRLKKVLGKVFVSRQSFGAGRREICVFVWRHKGIYKWIHKGDLCVCLETQTHTQTRAQRETQTRTQT